MALTADRMRFADGLELAADLVERTGVTDPEILLDAAQTLEVLATSSLEFGAACGLRMLAAEMGEAR